MGKRIIQRARGKGSLTYRVRKKAFRIRISYPTESGTGRILKLLNIPCYSAPIAKVQFKGKIFYCIAANGIYEGQEIAIGKEKAKTETGNITALKNIPIGTSIFNLEILPGEGPKLIRSSGIAAKITKKDSKGVYVLLPSKEERKFDPEVRATIGVISGAGRAEKPLVKAGKAFYAAKAIGGRIYPRTSAVKMNVIDHPFGSGRGKRIKRKTVKRWAPPGRKVGLLKPSRTGKRK